MKSVVFLILLWCANNVCASQIIWKVEPAEHGKTYILVKQDQELEELLYRYHFNPSVNTAFTEIDRYKYSSVLDFLCSENICSVLIDVPYGMEYRRFSKRKEIWEQDQFKLLTDLIGANKPIKAIKFTDLHSFDLVEDSNSNHIVVLSDGQITKNGEVVPDKYGATTFRVE